MLDALGAGSRGDHAFGVRGRDAKSKPSVKQGPESDRLYCPSADRRMVIRKPVIRHIGTIGGTCRVDRCRLAFRAYSDLFRRFHSRVSVSRR